MCISVVATVERLSAYLACERLHARMYAHVFLVMLGIDKCRTAYVTAIWSFAGMAGTNVIFQETTTLERSITGITFVSLVVEMCGSLVRHQIRTLRKTGRTNITLIRSAKEQTKRRLHNMLEYEYDGTDMNKPFAGVCPLVIFNFCSSCECFTARPTDEWLMTSMHDFVHIQIVRCTKGL